VLIASAAASSHEVLLVPMISVTRYTLIAVSFEHVQPAPGLLRPACHTATLPGCLCRQVAGACGLTGDRGARSSAEPPTIAALPDRSVMPPSLRA
ncbi:MAG TPA: hypothetical protein VMA72_18595, partial [Streptosporangiaceae bacterium]|nr:hypothetical protein [Streptosporangiaceae bacterium]